MRNLMRIAATAGLLLSATPSHAVVPTEDVAVWTQLGTMIKQNIDMLNTAIETMTISNAMKAALGEGLGGEWAEALDTATGLYSSGQQLAYNASTKMTRLQYELDGLMPQSVEQMDIAQLTAFARRWQYAFQNDSIAARALQAEGIAQQAKINQLKSQSLRSSQKAAGVTSAVQAQTNLLGAMAGQLETTGMTLSSMANMQNNALMSEEKKNQIVEQWAKRNREIGAQMRAAGVKQAQKSPLRWGMP